MTSTAVDTDYMRTLAQRIEHAMTALNDLDHAWCGLDTCSAEFSGAHVRPVADALRELMAVLDDRIRESRNGLQRLGNQVVAVARVWDSIERMDSPSGQSQ